MSFPQNISISICDDNKCCKFAISTPLFLSDIRADRKSLSLSGDLIYVRFLLATTHMKRKINELRPKRQLMGEFRL